MLDNQQYPSHVKTQEEQVLFDQEFDRLSDELSSCVMLAPKKQCDPKVTHDFFTLCGK